MIYACKFGRLSKNVQDILLQGERLNEIFKNFINEKFIFKKCNHVDFLTLHFQPL